jgi:hypothetical protein
VHLCCAVHRNKTSHAAAMAQQSLGYHRIEVPIVNGVVSAMMRTLDVRSRVSVRSEKFPNGPSSDNFSAARTGQPYHRKEGFILGWPASHPGQQQRVLLSPTDQGPLPVRTLPRIESRGSTTCIGIKAPTFPFSDDVSFLTLATSPSVDFNMSENCADELSPP